MTAESETKLIMLTQGHCAIVDAADYDWLSQWKWCADRATHTIYARRNEAVAPYKQRPVKMHRVIMGEPVGMVVDHINHNGLDNRRANLRVCTNAENLRNRRGPNHISASGYRGVGWDKDNGKWISRIRVDGREKYLGLFDRDIDAARAWDAAARLYHGEFASLNFKEQPA